MKRDGQCLAILTPDFLSAHEELAHLEASWRASLLRRDVELGLPLSPFAAVQDRPSTASPSSSDPLEPSLVDRREHAHQAASEAYRKWVDAKLRHRPTLDWYEKVYERLRTRLDEEQILSEVRLVLLAGPGSRLLPDLTLEHPFRVLGRHRPGCRVRSHHAVLHRPAFEDGRLSCPLSRAS